MSDQPHDLDAEVFSGSTSIAKFLGMTKRRFKYFDSLGVLPTWKVRRTTFARRSSLRAWMADQEQRAQADRDARAKAAGVAGV